MGIEKASEDQHLELLKVSFSDLRQGIECEGVLALGKFGTDELNILQTYHSNLLLIDFDGLEKGFHSLVIDYEQAVKTVLDLFYQLGHTKIGMLTGIEFTQNTHEEIEDKRLLYFKNYLTLLKNYQSEFVYSGDFTVQGVMRR